MKQNACRLAASVRDKARDNHAKLFTICIVRQEIHPMKYIVNSKFGGTLLVLLGFACWFGASAIIPQSSDWFFVATYSIAGFAFFIVGCFLPEYRDKRFILGRRSVLQLMAFFFWLAGSATVRMNMTQAMQDSTTWIMPVLAFASIAIAFGSYFIAAYLIRDFRAPVKYAVFTENPQAESGPHD